MAYFKQDKKMSDDMENSDSFHSVIVPVNHVVTIECFMNEGCITRKRVIYLRVIYSDFN